MNSDWCQDIIELKILISLSVCKPACGSDFPPWYQGGITVTVPLLFLRKVLFSCISKKGRVVRHIVARVLMVVPNLASQSKWDCHQHGVMLIVALSSWALKACKSVNSAASLSSSVSPSLGRLQKAQFSFFPEMFVLIQPLKFCIPETTKTFLLEGLNFTKHSAACEVVDFTPLVPLV